MKISFNKSILFLVIGMIFITNAIVLAGQYTWTPTSGSGNINQTTYRNGGVSIGTSAAPPINGLLVKKNLAINITPVANPVYRLEVADNNGPCIWAHSENATAGHGVIWSTAMYYGGEDWHVAAIEGQAYGKCVAGRFQHAQDGLALEVAGNLNVKGLTTFTLNEATSDCVTLEKELNLNPNYPMLKSSFIGNYGVYEVDLRAVKCSSNVKSNWGIGGEFYGGYIGIKAEVAPGGTWAGYFEGDVYTTGSYQPSDERLKTNITGCDNAVEKLCKLKPVSFNYDVASHPDMKLPKRKQNGLLAEEVERVFPELVADIVSKEKAQALTSQGKKTESYKCVNYTALVPVLVKAIQEQQTQIKDLKKQIQHLKTY